MMERNQVARCDARLCSPFVTKLSDPLLLRSHRFEPWALHRALERGQFEPYLQPLVTREDIWSGAEVLMRWYHPLLGILTPAQFMNDLKTAGLLADATKQILHKTAHIWSKSKPAVSGLFKLAFNVSADQFEGTTLSAISDGFRRICNDPVIQLVAEMPEKECDLAPAQYRRLMAALARSGIQVAIDDFGVGDSRLHLFGTGAVAYLKIDRSFIDNVGKCARYENLVRAIVSFSRALSVKTLAEGVETRLQRDILKRLGVDAYQGYLFGEPMPCSAFVDALAKSRRMLHR